MEKNSNHKKKNRLIFFVLCSLFFVFWSLFYFWQGIYLPKDANSREEKIFLIKKGEGSREIAFNLEKEGLIKSAPLFRIYVFFKGISKNLQAGSYSLSPAMNIPQISEKFSKGEIIKIKVTFPEGFTIKEMEERLNEELKIKLEIQNFKIADFQEKFQFLRDAPADFNLQGYLFPDTYYFSLQESSEEIVRKMLKNFDQKLNSDLRKEISKQGKSIFEIVTMASLIEKEVRTFEDKKLVSGILWKRLKNEIPLQVDATISYITGKKTIQISIEETKIDHPYNTYKYLGLPPGPISNPGLDSLKAALYPEETEFWYYLSTPTGETIFSKTIKEHNLAKAKYLR